MIKKIVKIIIILIFSFSIAQLFSINIQEKFNALLNSLLGGYTQSLFFGKKTSKKVETPDYILFDLNVKDTLGNLAFIINKENMQYIIAENSIKQLQTMQDICKKINLKLQELQEKTATTSLLQKLRPYIKKESNKKAISLRNIENYKKNNYNMLQSWISAFNNNNENSAKLAMNINNENQIVISWDSDTDNLLDLKISTIGLLYTLLEGLKPLILENKKLNVIHQKWSTINEIQAIPLNRESPLKTKNALNEIFKKFSKNMNDNLNKTKKLSNAITEYLKSNIFSALTYAALGTTQVTFISTLKRIIEANMPNIAKEVLEAVLKNKISIFFPTNVSSVFLKFVFDSDAIEKELLDIFDYNLTDNAEKIISKDLTRSIKNFNADLKNYLEHCLLASPDENAGTVKTFNDNKAKISKQLHQKFAEISKLLPNNNIFLHEEGRVIKIDTTESYKEEIEINKKKKQILNSSESLDEQTKKYFENEINKIIHQEKNSKEILLDLKNIQTKIQKIAVDTKEKNNKIQTIQDLLSLIKSTQTEYPEEQKKYQKRLNAVQKQRFLENHERDIVLQELADLEIEIKTKLPKQKHDYLSGAKKTTSSVIGFLRKNVFNTRSAFGWITSEERINLKNFINEQYNSLAIKDISDDLQKKINNSKNQDLIAADKEKLPIHRAEELKNNVENKIKEFKEEIKNDPEPQ